jgi:hypothetical protein
VNSLVKRPSIQVLAGDQIAIHDNETTPDRAVLKGGPDRCKVGGEAFIVSFKTARTMKPEFFGVEIASDLLGRYSPLFQFAGLYQTCNQFVPRRCGHESLLFSRIGSGGGAVRWLVRRKARRSRKVKGFASVNPSYQGL